VEARLDTAVAPTGLSLAKLGVLQHLVEADEPLPLGRLAERIACVKSNITQLVDRLEGEGLVCRELSRDDRRVVRAVITAQGRRVYGAGARARAAVEEALAAGIPAARRAELAEALDSLARAARPA